MILVRTDHSCLRVGHYRWYQSLCTNLDFKQCDVVFGWTIYMWMLFMNIVNVYGFGCGCGCECVVYV
jgi:hypothetical protein